MRDSIELVDMRAAGWRDKDDTIPVVLALCTEANFTVDKNK